MPRYYSVLVITVVVINGFHCIFNNTLANGCYKLHKSPWGEVCVYVGVCVGGGGAHSITVFMVIQM